MIVWNDWRLLRDHLIAKGLLDTELTDDPLDDALIEAAMAYVANVPGVPPAGLGWEDERYAVAAIQVMAKEAGVETGDVDGLPGPQTRHAHDVMEYRLANAGAIDKEPEEVSSSNPATFRTVSDAQARAHEPASIRYSNPGAMYPGPSSKMFGSTRHEVIGGGHLIAVFDSDEQGAAAQFDLLDTKYVGLTMQAAIAKWCGGNSAAVYAARVNKETGVSPDEILTHKLIRDPVFAIPLARAMAQVEAGKPFPMDEDGWRRAHTRAFIDTPVNIKKFVIPAADGAIPQAIPASPKGPDALEHHVWPRQAGVPGFYGEMGKHQVKLALPFPMRLAWQPETIIRSISLHEKVYESAGRVFQAAFKHYGAAEITRLRLDLFGGSLNVRKMRGSNAWSMHSWGIAIDFDPDRNQLQWGSDRATLAKPEYAAFFDMWESEGWLSLGRARNIDWMHVQAARL